jgi:glycosyltransferase involved in cell wall biosynthesis
MRIALVAPHAALPDSHSTSHGHRVTSLAQSLAGLGHCVTVYTRKDSAALPPKVEVAPGVTIEHVTAGPAARVPADQAATHLRAFSDHLAERWQQDPPDIAHAHFWTSGLAALAGARGLDVPVVQTFHSLGTAQAPGTVPVSGIPAPRGATRGSRGGRAPGGSRPQGASRPAAAAPSASATARRRHRKGPDPELARIRLEVCLARNVKAVLATSSDEMQKLAGLGVPRTSMRLVPWGVDTGLFAPEGPVALRNGRPRLLAVRHTAGPDGIDVVIRALAEVPAAELLIAGGPSGQPRGGDQAHKSLRALARDLGVAERVTFSGKVSWEDLPALLRSADLLVSGAWDEPFGTVALQAMACGTPVAAPALGVCEDAVIDGTTGILVPPGQPSVLAMRIRRLLASPVQLDAFGIAAADRARSRYSWDRIGQETVRAYERCLPRMLAEPAEDLGEATEDDDELEPADSLAEG